MKRTSFLIFLLLSLTSIAKSQERALYPLSDANGQRAFDRAIANLNTEGSRCLGIRDREHPDPFARCLNQGQESEEFTFSINNDTSKTVWEVSWECTLINPNSKGPALVYTFVSKKRIRPYTGSTLRESVPILLPLNSKATPSNARCVSRIVKIKYTDGSIRTF